MNAYFIFGMLGLLLIGGVVAYCSSNRFYPVSTYYEDSGTYVSSHGLGYSVSSDKLNALRLEVG